jgi:hypothetical protein
MRWPWLQDILRKIIQPADGVDVLLDGSLFEGVMSQIEILQVLVDEYCFW